MCTLGIHSVEYTYDIIRNFFLKGPFKHCVQKKPSRKL